VEVRRIVLVAQDSPVQASQPPPPGRRGRSVAQVQYDLLSAEPFRWTENEVLFESWWRRQDAAASASEAEKESARAQWLQGSRPCLRASPLPQRHGWGLVFDDEDRVALCAVESDEYRALASGAVGVEVQRSFRRSRS
jgi:Family of unknown function (DUF6157)